MTMARSEIRCKTFTPRWLITRNFLGQSRGRFSSSPVVAVLLLRPLPALTGLPCTSPLLPPRLVAGEKEVAQRVITPFIGHGDQLCMFVFSLQGTTKMLLPLSILQLLLAPALAVPSVDHWDTWGPYGECSRSCGSGVTMRTRRCITLRTDGGHNCVGPEKSYRSCNIQDCPEGSRDFREEQCSGFDGTDFQGKRYKWLPYYGAENPCELNCMPRGENFFYRHRSAVVDGTPCHPGRRDVCVGGVCKRLGCDNMLESAQQEDPCLQCGGSGQSCHRVKNSFSVRDLPTGYNQMFIIPVGATTISIRETVATRNYLGERV
ncbi:hypothetical protein F2P81_003049 [Scophthalmus maximus]|uniref:ADAMTS/ADAMTS-like cysteine-rich domain-containing protein n=1 Tax=Scophthalmus maximus TaxID=52904 RepID=A0A6A4TM48_SCOMX|nr:hypothetical protein F2P81_003049 [Scophthalmus maximus]